MKTYFNIATLFEGELSPELMHRLETIFPEGRNRHYFECCLEVGDPRVKSIKTALAEGGMQPWIDRARPCDDSREYLCSLIREYDADDLAASSFLELRPKVYYQALYRNEDDAILKLDGREPRPIPDFASASASIYVIPNRTREILESGNFEGIVFGPTINTNRRESFVEWWELRSSIELPPLSDTLELQTSLGLPLPEGDFTASCRVEDGLYAKAELRYREKDLSAFQLFDIGHTKELINGDPKWKLDRPLIVSQRFYQFCLSKGLHSDWVPVRLDP